MTAISSGAGWIRAGTAPSRVWMPSKGSQLWGRPLTVTRQRCPSPGKMALTALASSPMKDGGSSAVTP